MKIMMGDISFQRPGFKILQTILKIMKRGERDSPLNFAPEKTK